jgi:trigger factor
MFEITGQNKNIKTVRISLPHEQIERARDGVYEKISRDIKIKGFRPGMVPRSVLNTIIGIEKINEMIKEEIADIAYESLIKDKAFDEMNSILPPELKSVELAGDAEVVMNIHTLPKCEIESLDGVEVKVPNFVSDEELEKSINEDIERLRNEHAVLVPKAEDQGIELEDEVDIEYTTNNSGEKQNIELVVKDPSEGNVFAELIGKKVGDEFDFTDKAENTGNSNTLHIKVNKVYLRKLPEVNDDFAKSVDEQVESMEALRSKMKEEIIESFDKAIESLKKDMIMMELLKRIKLDLADSSLDFFVNTLIEMKKEKKEYEKELKDEFKGDEKKYLESIKSESLNYLKMKSALEELAKEKGIEISEAEIFDSAKQRYEGAKISDERIKVLIEKNQGIKDEIK